VRELSLFTGAGGGLLGSKLLGWRHCGYVEYNEYCQKVIAQRIKDGILDDAPIFGDIRAFIDQGYADSYKGMVDVVTAGFPCQPFSVAGRSEGEFDPRNMWPQTIQVIRAVRPRYALLENVPGLLAHPYYGTILGDLHKSGFNVEWDVISASSLGAQHLRERLWILAYSDPNEIRCDFKELRSTEKTGERGVDALRRVEGFIADAPYTKQNRWPSDKVHARPNYESQGVPRKKRRPLGVISRQDPSGRWWAFPDADPDRSFDDVADWVDRISACGNGQVPIVAKSAWEILGGPI
jgi:DNA (cytosine-5)-methyltransferase 1